MLSERALRDVLADVAAPTPAPGGGTSAAVACALAAALVEMSAGVAHERARALQVRALELADADLTSYGPVLDALRLPRDDPARAERIATALSAAAETPLAIAETAADVADAAAELAADGRPSLQGDAATGVLLAEAATRAAAHLVELNLAELPSDPRLARARALAAAAAAARERALAR